MRLHRVERLALAAGGYLLAAALTWTFWSAHFQRSPFVLFFGAAAVAAWLGGFWTGFGVSLAGAITGAALLGDVVPEVLVASVVMIGVAALISYRAERARQVDSELEEANGLLETVLDQAPVGIALFDRNLRCLRLNAALAGIDGRPVAGPLGKPAAEALPRIGAGMAEVLRRVIETGEPTSREITTEAAAGERRHLSIHAYALELRGEIVGAGAVCEEVTSQRRAQEELRQAMERAEAASAAKDHFLAALSHELRTPLTPVLAVAALLEEEPRLPAYVRDHLAMIRRNVELEARLIDDLLDLTRISRGKLELRPHPTDVRPLLADAVRNCEQDREPSRVRVESDLAAASHLVRADGPRLAQVFWNLLDNAFKFTPAGGSVQVRSRDEGGWLSITVADTGVGIEPARLARIFEAFVALGRGESAIGARGRGLGFGLAMSNAIVELHGGTLTAASAGPGRGSTFTIRLPLLAEAAETAIREARPAPATAPGPRLVAPIAPIAPSAPFPRTNGGAAAATGEGANGAKGARGAGGGAARDAAGPAAPPPAAGTAAPAGTAAGTAAPAVLRILLVEDHADTAAIMAELLDGLGYRVTVAGSVSAALAEVERLAEGAAQPPLDLVISDLGLPDGNGQELMQELSRRYQLRGIALSGYGMDEDRAKSLRAGFSRHLIKPIHPRALHQVIREVAGGG